MAEEFSGLRAGRNEGKEMERTPRPGEIYRHFKNKLYQVIAVAYHTETGEELVVYQALYGTYGVYARPLAMFTGKVDKEKYPDVKQEYRFERADFSQPAGEEEPDKADRKDVLKEGSAVKEQEQSQKLNPLLLSFVDTKDFDVKLEILSAMEDSAKQEDVDALCESLDLPKREGNIGEQIRFIRQYLEMRKKFDNKRLR